MAAVAAAEQEEGCTDQSQGATCSDQRSAARTGVGQWIVLLRSFLWRCRLGWLVGLVVLWSFRRLFGLGLGRLLRSGLSSSLGRRCRLRRLLSSSLGWRCRLRRLLSSSLGRRCRLRRLLSRSWSWSRGWRRSRSRSWRWNGYNDDVAVRGCLLVEALVRLQGELVCASLFWCREREVSVGVNGHGVHDFAVDDYVNLGAF